MRYFCTLFDANYLPNFLALYNSLEANIDGDFKIYAFCMDDRSFTYLSDYKLKTGAKIVTVSLPQLITYFPQLDDIKKQRTIIEFYFTCSPFICRYVLCKEQTCTHVTYLDADLLFFDSPEIIFEEISDASVAIISHKFYGWGKRYIKYGTYNVGWLTFKNDATGNACLQQWLADCEEWCYDYYDEEGERFGDQKYLDNWENAYENVKTIQQKGANLAPWNAGQYNITLNKQGKIFIDQDPLVFHHFASFKKVNHNTYTTSMSRYLARPGRVLKTNIYKHYLNKLTEISIKINKDSEKNNNVLQRNRPLAYQTDFKKKLTGIFTSLTRWYFQDYIKR
ncbi:MAG: hypothetical protein JWO58_3316 [Chitinophagaceae bacterium]|nr:hypothetical protein [Chitinophagaceae bacterium]